MKFSFARITGALTLVFMFACAASTYGQNNDRSANPPTSEPSQTSAPATPAQQTTLPGQTSQENKDQKNQGTSNDRLFFALPNFLTLENSAQVPPLTAKQKFKVALRSSFDYVQYPWYAALAGISQAENSEPGYGQGAEG